MKTPEDYTEGMERLRLEEGYVDLVALPDDIFYIIFSYLSPQELATVCRVCRRFNMLASSDAVWVGLLSRRFVVDPHGKLNPDHSGMISAKLKFKVSLNWNSGRCKRSTLAHHHVKLLPCLQLYGSQLWVSQEHRIKRYDISLNGSWTERSSDQLQIHPDQPEPPRRNRRSRGGARRIPSHDITHFICKDDMIIAGNSKGEVCAWDKSTKEQTCRYTPYHRGEVHCVDVLNDYILSGSRDGTVLISPLRNENSEGGNPGSTACLSVGERIWSLAASPSRCQYVTGSAGCLPNCSPLVLWDFATGQEVLSLDTGSQVGAGVLAIRFETPDCLLTCGYDTYLKLWDLRTPSHCVGKWEDPDDQALFSMDTDHGHSMVTGGARFGVVRLWDKRSTRPVQSYYNGPRGHSSPVYAVAMDASRIFVALDKSINVLDFWRV